MNKPKSKTSDKSKTSGRKIADNETDAEVIDTASAKKNKAAGTSPAQGKGDDDMNETSELPQVAAVPERAEISLARIVVDEESYPRDGVNKKAVKAYAAAMAEGAQFPDIDVYVDGDSFALADGRHRVKAAQSLGLKTIRARVYHGTRHEATLHAVMSCGAKGVRRTSADKRKGVMILLRDPEWGNWNDSEIARRCNVSPDLVKTIKSECGNDTDDQEPDSAGTQLVLRNGKEEKQKRKAAAKPLPSHIAAIAEMRELARSACASVIGADPGLAERLQHMGSELHEILGMTTGAQRMTEGLREPLNVYERECKTGIEKDEAFEEKGLATHAFNIGFGCGHQCSYCSSASVRCLNKAYGELQVKPSSRGFAVIDPKASDLISADKPKLTAEDTVMLSTCDDAWSPEARKYGVGRKCLEALLLKTTARVRILTKSADVVKDLVVAKDDKDRVMVGLSLGIPDDREEVAEAIEPNASPIRERLKALKQAHDLKFPVYAMFCPCLPGVADTEPALERMLRSVRPFSPEGVWLEPVNARVKALQNTEEALRVAGLTAEADAVAAIREQKQWSKYAADLAETAAGVAEKLGLKEKLHVLMYTDKLTAQDLERVKALGGCVILLGKDKAGKAAEAAGADDPEADDADTEDGDGGGTEAA